MNLPLRLALRSSLAAGLLIASVTATGVASASDGAGSKSHKTAKAKSCKKGKEYRVDGTFAGGDLVRVAGGATAKRSDDRYTGTVVIEVDSGNRRGQRDVGLRSYTVTGVRAFGITIDGALPFEGASIELGGKLKAACAVASRLSVDDEAEEGDVSVDEAESDDDAGSGGDVSEDDTSSEDDVTATAAAVTDVNVRVVRFKTN